MQKKRSRFALLGILALAFTVTAGLTISSEAVAKKKKKGGGGTKTISKGGGPIPDATFPATPTGNGGEFHLGVLASKITVGRKFAGAKIKDLNVQVTLSHNDIGDLLVQLVGANGQLITLFDGTDNNPPGTTTPPFFSLGALGPTTFDDTAPLFINDTNSGPAADPDPPTTAPGPGCTGEPDGGGLEARPPYAGSFKPADGTLGSLGRKLQGSWVLLVIDSDPVFGPGDVADIGSLTNWKLIAQLKGGKKKKKKK